MNTHTHGLIHTHNTHTHMDEHTHTTHTHTHRHANIYTHSQSDTNTRNKYIMKKEETRAIGICTLRNT